MTGDQTFYQGAGGQAQDWTLRQFMDLKARVEALEALVSPKPVMSMSFDQCGTCGSFGAYPCSRLDCPHHASSG